MHWQPHPAARLLGCQPPLLPEAAYTARQTWNLLLVSELQQLTSCTAERVVHARGASAKGFFEVTHDISQYTCADVLRAPGVQTPVIVRFSTVIHERGSPETLRDPRGFAVKFYTREGNWDLVGNNFPVCHRRSHTTEIV